MNGWVGKILRVDLSKNRVSVEDLREEAAHDYIGGRGLGIKYLYDEIDPKVDPFSRENKLMLVTGPLTGTNALAGGRYTAVTKSPLTGAIANSNSGGYFGAELKYAGYDMIILEGKAKAPVYLWIENDSIEIRSAKHLWGKDSHQTTELIAAEADEDAKVACIGPAGENLVKFANIMNDNGRAAGRSGVGAVMGSKNLKAVAVRGTNGVTVADPEGFREAVLAAIKEFHDPYMSQVIGNYGTSDVVEFSNEVGLLPTRNFQTGVFEGASKIGGSVIAKYNLRGATKTKACFGCPLGCGRVTRVPDGEFKGEGEGPEYETLGSLGSVCGVENPEAVMKANYICNRMGMDTISAGVTIGCAMELFEKGYLPEKDVGMSLKFGDGQAMVHLLENAARRKGFGDVIAEGSYRLAERYGHPELSMTAKKLEFPNYDPRGGQGFALAYATQNRGGCHIRNEVHCVEFFGISLMGIIETGGSLDRFTTKGKPEVTKRFQDFYCMIDSSGICNFIIIGMPDHNVFINLMEKGTGLTFGGLGGFLNTGERIFNLERLFNLKAGLTSKDDTLPWRMLEEPMPEGPGKGHVVRLNEMLPEYYKLRGWTVKGVPTERKLAELGISTKL